MNNTRAFRTLQEFVKEIYSCVHCGYCLDSCPTRDANYFDVYGSRGKMLIFKALLENMLRVDEDFADRIFNCALCNWCAYKCPEELPTTEIFAAARYEAARRGLTPDTVKKSVKYVIERDNPFGAPVSERTAWSKGLNLKKRGESVLFASCMNTLMGYVELIHKMGASFDSIVKMFDKFEKIKLEGIFRRAASRLFDPNKRYHETLRKSVEILNMLGIEPAYWGEEEPCCGKPLHTYGYLDKFEEHARNVAELFRNNGVKRLIILNPICTYTFRVLYPKFLGNFDIEVKHISEILAENLDKWADKAVLKRPIKITYHDPCYMARYMDIIEPPRTVMKNIKGVELVEPARYGKNTYCTGDGGIEVTHPESAAKIALKRTRMLLETGAEKIVTTCPACIAMINLGLRLTGSQNRVETLDLIDLVYEALKK